MKKKLTNLLLSFGIGASAIAQTVATGPSSSMGPFFLPTAPGYSVTSILTTTNVIGGYKMCGIPDGLGAYDNNDGTFTLLMTHEFGSTLGVPRAHGSTGAFVSKWVINKTTLAVTNGSDLIQNVKIWNGTGYTTYNANNTSTLAAIGRFCSADLPPVTAFYNSSTGRGTQEKIFMSGEESGSEGRVFANIATGPNAGTSYQLPYLGKFSWENACANPKRSDKTIVIGMDDTTPGQVYVYVGNKTTVGTEIEKAGLTGGNLYGVNVSGMLVETNTFVPSPSTTFSLVNLNTVQAITGASLNTLSNNLGVTNFLRPEDGAWNPSNPNDFYFNTTNGFGNPSRVWKLHFDDLENPQLGGTITAVLDGTEGQQMLDNMGIDNSGHIILQEDVGNNAHLGKMWEYTIATDALVQIGQHDPNFFLTGAPNFLTQDEEASGVIDVQSILGPGKFLFVDQLHYPIPGDAVEGGQLMLLASLNTQTSNPEINIQGNATSIPLGNVATSAVNNTDFGTVNTGVTVNKTFVIQNTGTGVLVISGINFTGNNAGDFVLVSPPAFPANIAANGSLTITVSFNSPFAGTRIATLNVYNNDFNESLYDFAVKGEGAVPEINLQGNNQNIVVGNLITSLSDNTHFGSVVINTPISKTFVVQNTGNGTLTVSGMNITGANSPEFTLINPPAFPVNIVGGSSLTFTVQFLPTATGTRTAKIGINNTDSDESLYDFLIEGVSLSDVGLVNIENKTFNVSISPNPANDQAILTVIQSDNKDIQLQVIDVLGRTIILPLEKKVSKNATAFILNTASLANGQYFIKVIDGSQIGFGKITVAH